MPTETPRSPLPGSNDSALPDIEERSTTLTMLVDEVFRLNAAFLSEGDLLAAEVGLTAARWRILGLLAKESTSVAEIARRRGQKRQSVQESVERLERDGMVVRVPNDADRRAPLVVLTDQGRTALREIEPIRAEWARKRSAGIDPERLRTTLKTLQQLQRDSQEWPADPDIAIDHALARSNRTKGDSQT